MQRVPERTRDEPVMARVRTWLERVIAEPTLHARFVNSLARMEYVGVRKMLKARRAESLDANGLQHVIEEAGHALRLKRAALALSGGSETCVATFAEEHTLAGGAAEEYLQEVDRACEILLAHLPEPARAEANYLLTSAAIEIRANAFYPIYEEVLRAADAPFSVRAIQRDEDRHLAEINDRLRALFGDATDALLTRALASETAAFACWEAAMAAAVSERAEVAISARQ
jgi:hypothetical protein